MSWDDHFEEVPYYNDEEEDEDRCYCMACELKYRFAWVEESFFVIRRRRNKTLGEYWVFLSHSYPEGLELDSHFLTFLDRFNPAQVDLTLTVHEVEPGSRDLFNSKHKRVKLVKKLERELREEHATAFHANVSAKTFIKTKQRARRRK